MKTLVDQLYDIARDVEELIAERDQTRKDISTLENDLARVNDQFAELNAEFTEYRMEHP